MGERHVAAPGPEMRGADWRVLAEGDGALGLVLWQELRHLRDWLLTPPERRAGLFHAAPPRRALELRSAARVEAPELAGALEVLRSVRGRGGAASPVARADACGEVARWAEGRGAAETAVEFADLAAWLDPGSAARANVAGRLSRLADEYARAELWFERGIALARRADDRVEYTRGHIGSGILCQTLGRDEDARRHFNTASVVARRDGRHWLAAEAQHDLMLMLTECGRLKDAYHHARTALAWYPKHHTRFPYFAADAAFLLISGGAFAAAVSVLDPALAKMEESPVRVLIRSILVRALAGARLNDRFVHERREVLNALRSNRLVEAPARVHIAEGDLLAGQLAAARRNAQAALDAAKASREAVPHRLALDVLKRIDAPAPLSSTPAEHGLGELAGRLADRLQDWAPTRRGRGRSLQLADWAA
jgi:tetratricopeptide (TPR) repeat protein